MAVPTKEAGRTEPRDGAAPELSSIQFSAQFTEEITESQEPQPDTADITETPGIPGMPDMPGALPEDDILSPPRPGDTRRARQGSPADRSEKLRAAQKAAEAPAEGA